MAEMRHKRRNYLIKKRFQIKYTLSITLLLLIVMATSGVGIYLGMWGSIIENFSKFKVSQNLENVKRITDYESARYRKGDYRIDKVFREAELLSAKEKETLQEALHSVNRSLAPKVILLVIIIFIAGIFISHKIAGPMYRIEKSARAIQDGNLNVNFNIRRGDEMKETASVLEEMVETLHKDIKDIKAATAELEGRLRSVSGKMTAEEADGLKAVVKDIDTLLAKYKT
jgi:methyl-accepting chemotaxis protein